MSRELALWLRGIALLLVLLAFVWALSGCATAAKPAFPPDMRIVCHEGTLYLGSVSAGEVVRLPLSCI